MNYTVSR